MSQEIRVAFAGVGNCTSSLIQGLTYYRDLKDTEFVPGLMHPVLGDYRIRDIVPVAAFDVDARKVGQELAEAILAALGSRENRERVTAAAQELYERRYSRAVYVQKMRAVMESLG